MNDCPLPIDPIDAQALAAGEEPLIAPDAREHVDRCPACRLEVEKARELAELLGPEVDSPTADLADRILRVRAFSRRELRDFRIWRGALGLSASFFFGGLFVLTLPALTVREQAGLGVVAAAPLMMLLDAVVRALGQAAAATPSALAALATAARQQPTVGAAALIFLVPVALGLRRALARARS